MSLMSWARPQLLQNLLQKTKNPDASNSKRLVANEWYTVQGQLSICSQMLFKSYKQIKKSMDCTEKWGFWCIGPLATWHIMTHLFVHQLMGMGWKWSWSVWLVFKTKIVNHRRQLCTKPYHIQRSWYNERNYLYTPVPRWSEKHSQHLQLAICVSVHPEPWPLNFWGPFPDLQWIDYCWLLVGPSLGGRLSVCM